MVQQLAEKVDPAVVQVIVTGYGADEDETLVRVKRSKGSGVVVSADGYILTNAHVVGVARRVQVLLPQPADDRTRFRSALKPSGKLLPAEVVGLDRQTDIAVLKVNDTGLPALPFADSDQVRQGQLAIAFGSPFGLENSVTLGVVSSVARQVRADDPMVYLQTDAAINPGNSGGPLVDATGAIAGINTFILTASGANAGVGFAVPSNIARAVYEQIRQHGRVRRGQVGVIAQSITPGLAQGLKLSRDWGVIIADVTPRSAAEAAGLEPKDLVLTFNGKVLENARQFGVNVYQHAGDTITLEIERGGQKMTKQVTVLERPEDPDRLLSLVRGEQGLLPKLGILALDLDEKTAPLLPALRRLQGVVVAGVVADAASDEESLRQGDVIYEVNNRRVNSVAALREALAGLKHGDPVAVYAERSGQQQFILLEIE